MSEQTQPDPIDSNQYETLREEREQTCPFKPCRGLEQDEFYLRDIRTNRLLCNWCAVHTSVGYIGKDVAKQQEARYFKGTTSDYFIAFGITTALSAFANTFALFIGFFIFALFVGGVAGPAIGTTARRATGGRVGRYSPQVAVAGVVAGGLLSPTLFFLLRVGAFVVAPQVAITDLSVLLCTGIIGVTVYGIFMRRI